MRLIGYWISSLDDAEYLPPQEFVADIGANLRRTIADYLDAGQEFCVYRGLSWCRFFCDHPGSSCELSDGHWVWPADLSHYVRDHNVWIPDEFVEHIQAGVPQIPKSPEWDSHLPDTTFWKEWCRHNRSGEYRDRLDAALRDADIEAERILAAKAGDMERTRGTSTAICRWAGCQNHAIVGKSFCARCLITFESNSYVSHLYHDIRGVLN